MNKIKELIQKIIKKEWIISIFVLLILIILGVTIWPLHIFRKDTIVEQIESITKEPIVQATEQKSLTSEDVKNGEYKNDVESATIYVSNTQEVLVAVVADRNAQKILGNTTNTSCGHVAFVTTRVVGPAVLMNSLKALFENKVVTDFNPGNIIPIYHPDLVLKDVLIDNGVAKVYLEGNFSGENDGWCDASLAVAQITETAKGFSSVQSVEVYQGVEKIY